MTSVVEYHFGIYKLDVQCGTDNEDKHFFFQIRGAKGQLISKGLFKVFICIKNEQKYFCISALAYKKRSNKKSSS